MAVDIKPSEEKQAEMASVSSDTIETGDSRIHNKIEPSPAFVEEMHAANAPNNTPTENITTSEGYGAGSLQAAPSTGGLAYAQPVPVSENTLKLSQKRSFSWSGLFKVAAVLVLLGILIIGALMLWSSLSAKPKESVLNSYNVSQSTPAFAVKFFADAQVIQQKGNTYLLSKDTEGKMTEIWIQSVSSLITYETDPPFTFTMNGTTIKGTHSRSGNLYVARVQSNGRIYQISMTSQRPIIVTDAKAIFSSVTFL